MSCRAVLELGAASRRGLRHKVEGSENHDVVALWEDRPEVEALLLVADGMGGRPRPRDASHAAAAAARERFHQGSLEDPQQFLLDMLGAAHRAVCRLGDGGGRAPGSTLCLALIMEGELYGANVGDGTVFLERAGVLRILAGGEGARSGNRPSEFLGSSQPPAPESFSEKLQPGDQLLLCTDGLTPAGANTRSLLETLQRRELPVQTLADQLAAQEHDDDTTLALARVLRLEKAPARAGAARARPHERRKLRLAWSQILPALLLGAAAGLAGGYGLWKLNPPSSTSVPVQPSAVPREWQRMLPAEPVVLIDPLNGAIYSLSGRSARTPPGPVHLDAFRLNRQGRLAPVGRYRYDPARHLLEDAQGEPLAVEAVAGSTALRPFGGGIVQVPRRASDENFFWNGRSLGATPLSFASPPGRFRWEVRRLGERVAGGEFEVKGGAEPVRLPR